MNGELGAQKSEESCPMSHSSREPTFSDGFYISPSITTVLHPYSKYQEAEFQCHEQDLQGTLWKWKWVLFFFYKLFPNCGFRVFYSYYIYLLLRSLTSVQFSSVQSLSHVRLFVTPWTAAHQASLSVTNSQSLPKPMSIE